MINTEKSFGYWLRYWRGEHGLSQRAVAEKLGVGFPHVSKVERGLERPSVEFIGNVSELFDLEFVEMLEAAGRCRCCGAVPELEGIK